MADPEAGQFYQRDLRSPSRLTDGGWDRLALIAKRHLSLVGGLAGPASFCGGAFRPQAGAVRRRNSARLML